MANNQPREGWFSKLGITPTAPFWGLGDAALTLIVLLVSMIIIASTLAALLSGANTVPSASAFVAGWIAGLLLSVAFTLIRWRRDPQMFAGLRLGTSRYSLFLALLLGVAAAFTADLAAASGSGGFFPAAPLIGLDSADTGQLALAALLVVIVQPLAEGLIFFGVLQPRLRATLGGYPGLLLTVLIYGGYYALVYGARLTGSSMLWYGLIFPLLIGLVAGILRAHADSTRAAAAVLVGAGLASLTVMIAIA